MKLRFSSDQEPGFTRKRCGRGFSYFDPEGARLPQGEHRDRIKALVIPPAYESVWICTHSDGHLQATGRDQRQRKQYRYHEEWQKQQNQKKFDSLLSFAEQLPALRGKIKALIKEEGLTTRHISALVLSIIDNTGARIGTPRYREENGTHGISTLTKDHLEERPRSLQLHYTGKHGKEITLPIKDKRLRREIMRCQDLPGEELFKYRGNDEKFHSLESSEVNDFLQSLIGEEFSAKTFRTWRASVMAFEELKDEAPAKSARKRKGQEMAAIRATASALHNTVATCRNYYIHPFILSSWMEGTFAEHLAAARRSRAFAQIGDEEERLFAKFLKQA